MNKKELLKEKVGRGFVPCFNQSCQLREHCLRWQGRDFVDRDAMVVLTVSPLLSGDACRMYQSDEPVLMAYGFNGLLDRLPRSMGTKLMLGVRSVCCRTYAYEYRNGQRPMTPTLQRHIETLCKEMGWEGDVKFDSYVESILTPF